MNQAKNNLQIINDVIYIANELINLRKVPIEPTPYIKLKSVGPATLRFYSKNPIPGKNKKHLLLVPSLINKPYIFDLLKGRSFIEYLVENDIDVYVIDWGVPNQLGRYYSFDEYLTIFYHTFVEFIKNIIQYPRINIMGYCIGGTLSFIYSSIYPHNVNSLINLASPIDFSNAGILRKWVDISGIKVETITETFGNIPPEFMYIVFSSLKPVNRISAIRFLIEKYNDKDFIQFFKAMELWTSDNIPFPGKFAIKYINDFYKNNKLLKGELIIDNKVVDMKNYKNKFLNILSTIDHIVPLHAASIAEELVGSVDKKSLYYNNVGHVGLMVGNFAKNNIWKEIVKWLKEE
jgi:polyhydroxyalkanoate synthase